MTAQVDAWVGAVAAYEQLIDRLAVLVDADEVPLEVEHWRDLVSRLVDALPPAALQMALAAQAPAPASLDDELARLRNLRAYAQRRHRP